MAVQVEKGDSMERADNRLALWSALLIAGVFMLAMLALCGLADLMLGASRR